MSKKKWQGYVFSREINGNIIPQRVQNLVIRTYVDNSGNDFVLSATEFNLKGSFMALWAVADNFAMIDGVVFYSVHMLPTKISERQKLYSMAFEHNVELHFALEGITIRQKQDTYIVEDLLMANSAAQKVNLF